MQKPIARRKRTRGRIYSFLFRLQFSLCFPSPFDCHVCRCSSRQNRFLYSLPRFDFSLLIFCCCCCCCCCRRAASSLATFAVHLPFSSGEERKKNRDTSGPRKSKQIRYQRSKPTGWYDVRLSTKISLSLFESVSVSLSLSLSFSLSLFLSSSLSLASFYLLIPAAS